MCKMDPPQFTNGKGSIDPPQPQQIIGNIDQILADPPDVNQLKPLPDPSVCGVSMRSGYGGRFHLQEIDDQHHQYAAQSSSPHNRISPHRHSPVVQQYEHQNCISE